MSQNLGHRQVVVFAGDAMLELAPRRGMKRASSWRPYIAFPFSVRGFLGSTNEVDADAHIAAADAVDKNSYDGKPDFDLLILDETDPVSFSAGSDLPPISFSQDATRPIISAIKDPIDQEILSGFLSPLQEACCEVGADGYLAPLALGEYYHDLTPDQMLGLNWGEDEVQVCRSELTKDDFIGIIETVREVAFANLPEPVGKANFCKLIGVLRRKNPSDQKYQLILQALFRGFLH